MTAPTPRTEIAERAEAAARAWVANPRMPRPSNPFPALSQDARQFACDFERYLLLASSEEGAEGGA